MLLQFNASGDPDKFTFLFWHSSQVGRSNLAFYVNDEVDRLIERGRIEAEQTEREKIYRRLHELIAADRPAAFLFIRRIFVGASAEVQGIQADPSLMHRSVKEWQITKTNKERR